MPSVVVGEVEQGRSPRVARALLLAGLAVPDDWSNVGRGHWGEGSRMNPEGMIRNAMERWIERAPGEPVGWELWERHNRKSRLRKHFALSALMGEAFLSRGFAYVDPPYPEYLQDGAAFLSIYTKGTYASVGDLILPLGHQLRRLHAAHRLLPGYVYYGLTDVLRRLVGIYDWRDAQAEWANGASRVRTAGSEGYSPRDVDLYALDRGAEPRARIPSWLGVRSRLARGGVEDLVAGLRKRDAWAGKVAMAVAALQDEARALSRQRLADFPYLAYEADAIGVGAGRLGAPDGPPALLVTMEPHDEIEGYAREAVRRTEMWPGGYVRGAVREVVVPWICIGMNIDHPRSMHRAVRLFSTCCRVLDHCATVLDLLKRSRARRTPTAEELRQTARTLVEVFA